VEEDGQPRRRQGQGENKTGPAHARGTPSGTRNRVDAVHYRSPTRTARKTPRGGRLPARSLAQDADPGGGARAGRGGRGRTAPGIAVTSRPRDRSRRVSGPAQWPAGFRRRLDDVLDVPDGERRRLVVCMDGRLLEHERARHDTTNGTRTPG